VTCGEVYLLFIFNCKTHKLSIVTRVICARDHIPSANSDEVRDRMFGVIWLTFSHRNRRMNPKVLVACVITYAKGKAVSAKPQECIVPITARVEHIKPSKIRSILRLTF